MRRVFTVLATLLIPLIGIQFLLAASGAFDTAPNDESFQPHRALGLAILLYALVLTVIAAVARMPGRLIGLTGLIVGLVVVQSLIRTAAAAFNDTGGSSTTAGTLLFGLHGLNGLLILAVAQRVARGARALSRPAVAGQPEAS